MNRSDVETDHDIVILRHAIQGHNLAIKAMCRQSVFVLLGMLLIFWLALMSKDRVPHFLSDTGYFGSLAALTYLGSCIQRLWEAIEARHDRKKDLVALLEDRYGIVER
jgi:hypothetical protein